MLNKKHAIVTAVAMLTGSLFFNLVLIFNKLYLHENTGIPLNLAVIYVLVISAGLIAIGCGNGKIKSSKFAPLCSSVAAINLAAGITGAVFIYIEKGNKFSITLLSLLIPLLIGVIILEKIFIRGKNQTNTNPTANIKQ